MIAIATLGDASRHPGQASDATVATECMTVAARFHVKTSSMKFPTNFFSTYRLFVLCPDGGQPETLRQCVDLVVESCVSVIKPFFFVTHDPERAPQHSAL